MNDFARAVHLERWSDRRREDANPERRHEGQVRFDEASIKFRSECAGIVAASETFERTSSTELVKLPVDAPVLINFGRLEMEIKSK